MVEDDEWVIAAQNERFDIKTMKIEFGVEAEGLRSKGRFDVSNLVLCERYLANRLDTRQILTNFVQKLQVSAICAYNGNPILNLLPSEGPRIQNNKIVV